MKRLVPICRIGAGSSLQRLLPRDLQLLAAIGVLTAVVSVGGCGTPSGGTKAAEPPPAKVENRVKESDLTRITLTPQAEKRLGVEVAGVAEADAPATASVAGEVMAIPGRALMVTAPAAGTLALARRSFGAGESLRTGEPVFRLTPVLAAQRDLKVTYEADVATAKARLDGATQQLQRAKQLLRDLAGSQRNLEAAQQEFNQAQAGYDAALARLQRLSTHPLEADVEMIVPAPGNGVVRQILAAAGQTVGAGAPLFEVVDFSRVWLRVPVFGGDAKTLAPRVRVQDVDGTGPVRTAVRVTAPPTADPLAVTTDLYFELNNPDGQLRPGQRLMVTLPSKTVARRGLAVRASAILYDVQGGTWVYMSEGKHVYRRQRVELASTEGDLAYLLRGAGKDDKVVIAGAAELFGTEFGAGK